MAFGPRNGSSCAMCADNAVSDKHLADNKTRIGARVVVQVPITLLSGHADMV